MIYLEMEIPNQNIHLICIYYLIRILMQEKNFISFY
jgi:hypothetical protein